jgi:hypothetical protein
MACNTLLVRVCKIDTMFKAADFVLVVGHSQTPQPHSVAWHPLSGGQRNGQLLSHILPAGSLQHSSGL